MLILTAVPLVEKEPGLKEPVIAKGGSSLILLVNITGEPAPEVKWYHNDNEVALDLDVKIEGDASFSRLTISNVKGVSSGKYKVTAKNEVGESSAEFDVIIKGEFYLCYIYGCNLISYFKITTL